MGAVAGIDWASETHVCCVIGDTDGSGDGAVRRGPRRVVVAGDDRSVWSASACRVWRSSVAMGRSSRC